MSEKTEGRLITAPPIQGHVPARVWEFESPFGTTDREVNGRPGLTGSARPHREYFGSTAASAGSGASFRSVIRLSSALPSRRVRLGMYRA